MPTGGRHIVHMADSDLIALLNGEQASSSLFGRDEEDRALLDEDGLPNDKFLEVVKAELVSFENRRKNEMRLRESRSSSFRKGGKKSDEDEYFRAGLHRPEYDSNEDLDEDDDSEDSSYRPNDSAFSDDDDDDDDDDEEEESTFEAKKLFTKREMKPRPGSVAKGTDTKVSRKSKGSKQKVKKVTSSSSVKTARSKSSLIPAAATRQSIRGSHSPPRKSKEKDKENEGNNIKNDSELFHVEMETKLSTCMLRIRGLLNTIKSLEGKLVTSNAEIEDKTSQLKSLQKKLHAIECKEKGRSRDEYAGLVSQLEQQLAKTRKLQEQTHTKLIEEKRLRNNADERCKSLRQNGERQKATINDLQSNLKLNKQELSDLQQKSQRIRSEHKSATTEAHALKETLGGAELEYKKLKSKNTEQAGEIRMLQSENENLRDDNRKIKHELFAAQDRIRHMSLELEVAREKENTRKAEYRFQNRRLQKPKLTKESIPNTLGDESVVTDDLSTGWDSDSISNMPIKTADAVPFYGATSSMRSRIAQGIAESNRRARENNIGTTTPEHSSFVANKSALRTTGFSDGNNSLGTGSKGGLRIASPARPPLSNDRGRHLDVLSGKDSANFEKDEYIHHNNDEDEENMDAVKSSISSLPPPPPSASKLPARAHSLSPLRRVDDNNSPTGVSLLAPPSPVGSDVSGRYSRLQKMYERVTAREQTRG